MPKGMKNNPIRQLRISDEKLRKQFTVIPDEFIGNCAKCDIYDTLDDEYALCMKCWDKQTSTITKKRFANARD